MPIVIIIIVIIIAALVMYSVNSSSKTKQEQAAINELRKKQQEEKIENRKNYVESLGPSTRIIINDGIHLFFKNDKEEYFGLDETGKTYSFDGLLHINKETTGISFVHKDSYDLCVGKCIGNPGSANPISLTSVNQIYAEMKPILRNNLYKMLEEYGVTPTHEYEWDTDIFGCDINSKQFYFTYGCPQVYDFSALHKVTIEDLSHNNLSDANYVIHVYLWFDDSFYDDFPYIDLYFDYKDATFNSLLAMFKGIKNRQ
ncbi:MAG: hypothetical protein E7571_00780 [Ruminococcaceae bacterium]|nr:hypothetical protein [Oscillospiraceae bacterium]